MGASDLHYGNVVAHGGYPMVIDLETFLNAEPRKGALPFPAVDMQNAQPGAGRTVFTHLSDDFDHQSTSDSLPKGFELAFDGMEFEIPALPGIRSAATTASHNIPPVLSASM